MNQKDQALGIINSLIKELKDAKTQIAVLNQEIYNLRIPKVATYDPTSEMRIDKILEESKDAMVRNIKRIEKEIKDAKSK